MKETGQEVYSLSLLLCKDEQQGGNHTYMSLGPTPPVTACPPVEKHFPFRSRLNCWQTKSQHYNRRPAASAVYSAIPRISVTQIFSAGSHQNHHWSIIVALLAATKTITGRSSSHHCNIKRISTKPLLSRPPSTCSGGRGLVGKSKRQKEAISDKDGATQKVCLDSCS